MFAKAFLCCLLSVRGTAGFAAVSAADASRTVGSAEIVQWSISLTVVLMIFFACVWGLRKLNGLNAGGAEKMRVLGGVSLGMREKVMLLQIGKKQLLLGVTPGRIETLLILEGDDCLFKEAASPIATSGFAQKLLQAIKTRSDV